MLRPNFVTTFTGRLAASAWLLVGVGACTPADDIVINGSTMGTSYTVRVGQCPMPDCASQLQQQVTQRLDELNAALSHYDAAADISNFNRSRSTDWISVSSDLAAATLAALASSARTDGAFDATVLSAVNTWGFGPQTDLPLSPPPASDVARSAATIGYLNLEARSSPPALRKLRPTVQLDLSGIAKGFAVDQLAYMLEAQGIRNYLVEIGGELRTAGVQNIGKPWRIGIETPPRAGAASAPLAIEYVIAPGDAGLATSGDYRNVYWLNERRIAHTINPATGRPVTHTLASVTVVAPSAADADALATALMVMGPVAGRQFAQQHDLATLFFVRTDDRIDVWMTDALRALLISS